MATSKTTSVRLDKDLMDAVDCYTSKTNSTRNALINDALHFYLSSMKSDTGLKQKSDFKKDVSQYKGGGKFVGTRLNESLHRKIESEVKRLRISKSEYVLKSIIESVEAERYLLPSELEIIANYNRQLLSIGRNLNQIVRAINLGKTNIAVDDGFVLRLSDSIKLTSESLNNMIRFSLNRGQNVR